MKNREIYLTEHGGAEVLKLRESQPCQPAAGEVRVRHHAIGLNFIDIYFRSGLYPLSLPSRLGKEAAGVVEAVGEGVTQVKVGDRVGYAFAAVGAYADTNCVAANRLLRLPDSIDDDIAAASMLKGCTAHYLLRSIYRVGEGDTILFYAAAGGVGSIACQWARNLGARVIGVVGSEAKVADAQANGCSHVLIEGSDNIPAKVREITNGAGVPVVYDSLGAKTFEQSLQCLRPRGIMVSYGNATGAVTGIALGMLAKYGSLCVTRPTLADFMRTDEDFSTMSSEVMQQLSGDVEVRIGQRFALEEVQEAHRALEGRRTVGATVIVP